MIDDAIDAWVILRPFDQLFEAELGVGVARG